MTNQEARKLANGLYRLYLKGGDNREYLLASVGRLHDGSVWYAPCNWVAANASGIARVDWTLFERVEVVVLEERYMHYLEECRDKVRAWNEAGCPSSFSHQSDGGKSYYGRD